jgi:ArsR family transcriptional regulator
MNDVVSHRVFELAAELFSVLSTPTRLRILYELCEGEKNVSQLLQKVGVSQSNISQHLGVLYRGGVLGRRRAGAQIFYHVADAQAVLLCKVLCSQRESLLP